MKAFFSDPCSLICLQDSNDHIFGFTDYYVFEKNHFKLFLQGDYGFDDLLANGLLAHPQARKAKVVYPATILNLSYLLDSMRSERRRQNGILVWATVRRSWSTRSFRLRYRPLRRRGQGRDLGSG